MGELDNWIYENWRAGPRKTVIRFATCRFCNAGRGLNGGTDARHGRWHGPFPSLDVARTQAANLRAQTRKECSLCLR